MNEYYTKIGKIDLGDLSKVSTFLEKTIFNLPKLNEYESEVPFNTDLDLNPGRMLTCTKYGTTRFFYTMKGDVLKRLFDDWDKIQAWVNDKVGNTTNTYPMFSFSTSHLFRHRDHQRAATVNIGLWNSGNSTTCFWENEDLVSHVRYEVGEAILGNVRRSHSVIVNDHFDTHKPRAILMWTTQDTYENIKQRLE